MMKKATVLLVQDARTQGNSTKRHLETAGHTVVWAGSGMSALLAASKYSVDLILLDVSLPDIDGSDLCHRFRSRRDTHAIPIILFTAHEPATGTIPRRADGPDDHLAKPFTQEQLNVKIALVLGSRAAVAEVPQMQPSSQQGQPGRETGSKPMPSTAGSLQEEQRKPHLPAAEQPVRPPARTEPRPEPMRTIVLGPRTALKPKPDPEPETVPPAEPVQQPAPKPLLRLVPKPQPAAAATAAQQAPPAASAEPRRTPAAAEAAEPPFAGSRDEVIDPSTGLFSRPQFEAMFSKEFKRAVRFKQQMSCMIIDLDGSDMGRKADDALVKTLIEVVQRTIREVDTAAWWTGGSLIVLLPNTIRNDAVQAGMRILEAVAAHHVTWPDATQITVNIGVAGLPDRKIDSEQKLIESAALACRRARQTLLPTVKAVEGGAER